MLVETDCVLTDRLVLQAVCDRRSVSGGQAVILDRQTVSGVAHVTYAILVIYFVRKRLIHIVFALRSGT